MKAAVTKKEIESALYDRFGDVFEVRDRLVPATLPTGIIEIDRGVGGFPRGAITEIYGPPSSGRISVLLSMLATATLQEETCALIDCNDTFDLSSAANAGIDFKRLLWVRCQNNLERAFKAADLVSHAGGFGLIVVNLCDVPAKAARRVMSSWWFRFRRAIENSPTALVVLTPVAAVRSCAALALAMRNDRVVWSNPGSVCETSKNSFPPPTQRRHLSLVRELNPTEADSAPAHSRLLQTMEIHVNRERPLDFNPGIMQFNPRLPAARLAIFGNLR